MKANDTPIELPTSRTLPDTQVTWPPASPARGRQPGRGWRIAWRVLLAVIVIAALTPLAYTALLMYAWGHMNF